VLPVDVGAGAADRRWNVVHPKEQIEVVGGCLNRDSVPALAVTLDSRLEERLASVDGR
jgi:hypothetical protein